MPETSPIAISTSDGTGRSARFVDWSSIGKGGSSVVYKVFDNELGVPLAIKILKQDHRTDPRYIESLRREVLISRRLRHPNICPIHDLYEGERGLGIVMDLIEGHDLKEWLQLKRGQLLESMPGRISLLSKLCRALVVAHTLIVHRDLKPANIFLRKGDIENPVIMDFGLSTPDDSDVSKQLEGGTPKYMAPEQFLRREVNQRADIYAMGIMSYEILTDGQIPVCSLKDVHKTGELPVFVEEDIVPPSAFCAAIPPELDRLILAMIEHDPAKRPESIDEVAEVLSAIKLLDPFRPFITPAANERLISVEQGLYHVGDSGGRACDQPPKQVRLSPYRMGATLVTNQEYKKFLSSTGYRAPPLFNDPVFGRDSHPVVMVTWEEAVTFARWAGGRLPTEMEWEVAAKSGVAANLFPWGSNSPRTTDANIDNLYPATTPVSSYRSNQWGFSDCCGNVWEWCSDSWNEEFLKRIANDTVNPSNQSASSLKSLRGGSFDSPAIAGRTTFRFHLESQSRRSDVGFRIVLGVT